MASSRTIYDPFSQESYWEEIKASKIQLPVDISDKGELTATPSVPHLKLVLISDTHCELGVMIKRGLIPDGDVLIHAGDITTLGDAESLRQFNDELATLPHKHKLVIAGNHELGFDPEERMFERIVPYRGLGTEKGWELLTNCTFLNDQSCVIDGVKFYGSSWHPLPGYPFYRPREELKEKWEKIPEDVDVLITHSPPLGYLDLFPPVEVWGCKYLLEKVEKYAPKLHVFGHVHPKYGALSNGKTIFANVASQWHTKDGFNQPLVYYIPKKL